MERLKIKLAGKSDAEIKRLLTAGANTMVGYQLAQREVISDDEVRLHLIVPASPDHPHVGNDVQVMQKVGSDWKYAGKYGVDLKEN